MSCPVHPHATGGEIKTIGLFPREGETEAQAYSRWRLDCGVRCLCLPESVLAQSYDADGAKVGWPFEVKLHETTPRVSARITFKE